MTTRAEVEPLVQEWLSLDKNDATRKEISDLFAAEQYDDLKDRLGARMEFGTAGLRAAMKAGYAYMNDLTIIQTTQGVIKYLKESGEDLQRGVVVGYDARHNSHKWAQIIANLMTLESIPVQLFSTICPTPFVAFTVKHCKAVLGIMVTASHNPKEDNGYKVYGGNGPQIVSPVDKHIAKAILSTLQPRPEAWAIENIHQHKLVTDPLAMCMKDYYAAAVTHNYRRDKNANGPATITYTAMHGVGYKFAVAVFEAFGHKAFIPVQEQIVPDPEFPTVKYPNPEEGKSALDLSFATATKHNSTVVLANDPDADRLAVAERDAKGNWRVFNGNETANLFAYWIWQQFLQANPSVERKNVYMLASTVSSKFISAMAEKEGFVFEETLTGFKWMGNRAVELMKEGKQVIFAFEEAIGFMVGTEVLDKDGISAAAVMAELVQQTYENNSTLGQLLDELYERYGYFVTDNSYWLCYSPETTNKIFEKIRHDEKYPTHIGSVKVLTVRDLTTGYDNSKPGNKATLPVSKSSHMITFTFDNGVVATLRTSGTEPKIKYYSELRTKDRANAAEKLHKFVEQLVEQLLEPQANGLTARKS